MSNNLKLQVLLNAVDRASRPFKAIQTESKSLSGSIRDTQKTLKELNAQAGRIEGFRKTSAQLAVTGQSLQKAKNEAEALAIQFKNTEKPTRAQAKVLESAQRAAEGLQLKYNSLTQSVKRQQHELQQSGINTRRLSNDEQRLKASLSETNTQLNRQRDALAKVSRQQAKLNAVKKRYESGKQLAGNLAGAGAAGVGVATAGIVAGVAGLKPGYDFAQKNSELQAVLGLDKSSADMVALRGQARQLGDTTAASADDAAAAQIIVAKSGADKSSILAQTPAILNLSLANKKTMEENAKLLIGTKSAFGLSDDKATHIADVISMAMNKSQATFEGFSDSMTYIGPVAKVAGVSLEQASAMTGALHDANVTGSMAGTGSSAVITRLQAPTGKAYDALQELGVKTADRKGNMRPLFTILKEIQASFNKNKLGSSQQGEYLKTIFGEEALKSSNVLLAAASSGKLDRLAKLIENSDGKTEELVKIMQDNLGGDFKEFQSAYEAVGIDLFDQQDSSLRQLTQAATKYVLQLDQWIQKNKGLSQTIISIVGSGVAIVGLLGAIGLAAWPVVTGINAITAAVALLGTVGAGIAGTLGAFAWPIALIVAGALAIRAYWEPLSAFFGGVVDGLKGSFAPLFVMFAPLKPMFDQVAKWFGDLIAPVSSTKESLDKCRNAGIWFGREIAYWLMKPIELFNLLGSKVDWLLEKMGLMKKESADMDANASKVNQYANGANGRGYSPSGGILTGGYAPVKAGGASYTDQSQHAYQLDINIPPGQNVEDVKRAIRETLEERDRQRRAAGRSRMTTD